MSLRFLILVLKYLISGLVFRESLQETTDFPMKYRGSSFFFFCLNHSIDGIPTSRPMALQAPHHPRSWVPGFLEWVALFIVHFQWDLP